MFKRFLASQDQNDQNIQDANRAVERYEAAAGMINYMKSYDAKIINYNDKTIETTHRKIQAQLIDDQPLDQPGPLKLILEQSCLDLMKTGAVNNFNAALDAALPSKK